MILALQIIQGRQNAPWVVYFLRFRNSTSRQVFKIQVVSKISISKEHKAWYFSRKLLIEGEKIPRIFLLNEFTLACHTFFGTVSSDSCAYRFPSILGFLQAQDTSVCWYDNTLPESSALQEQVQLPTLPPSPNPGDF